MEKDQEIFSQSNQSSLEVSSLSSKSSLTIAEKTELEKTAISVRRSVVEMVYRSKDGHIPSALSMVEILAALYFKVLKIDVDNPKWLDRDRFILSKGHGCASLYAVLAERGFFPREVLETFCQWGTILGGHPEMQKVPGIEVSTGSLGHGFPQGVGMALAGKIDRMDYRVFCVVGDGECNEGSIWEAALSAAHHRLDNLVVVIDHNGFQSSGRIEEVLNTFSLEEKWRAFGWETREIDGHDFGEVVESLAGVPFREGRPSLIVARTIKGKGISFMENEHRWHTMIPTEDDMKKIREELSLARANLTRTDLQ